MCARAVSAAIQRIEGVASVEVSLNKGFADVKLKPGNRVDPERIRQVVRDSGFTPKAADVRLAGEIVERGGKPALAVTGLDLVYLLSDHADARSKLAEAQRAVGRTVLATGRLPEAPSVATADAPRALELLDLTIEPK